MATLMICFFSLYFAFHSHLSDEELLPIIGKIHPSEHYYAKQQAEYIIQQVLMRDGILKPIWKLMNFLALRLRYCLDMAHIDDINKLLIILVMVVETVYSFFSPINEGLLGYKCIILYSCTVILIFTRPTSHHI